MPDRHWHVFVQHERVPPECVSRTCATGSGRIGFVHSLILKFGGMECGVRSTSEIESLVRQLVALSRAQLDGSAEVLLDVVVDGIRCRLESSVVALTGALSPREAEIVRMVAEGYPNKTIAGILEISSFTVSSYLRRIFTKFGVNSRAAMVALAMENRLLPQPPAPAAHPAHVGGRMP